MFTNVADDEKKRLFVSPNTKLFADGKPTSKAV